MYLGSPCIIVTVNTTQPVFYWPQLLQFLFSSFLLCTPIFMCYLNSCSDVWWHSVSVVWPIIIFLRIRITQISWCNGANIGIYLLSILVFKIQIMFYSSGFYLSAG